MPTELYQIIASQLDLDTRLELAKCNKHLEEEVIFGPNSRDFVWHAEDPQKLLMSGNLPLVKLAIAAGADVNAKNENGLTALMRASYDGHKEIVDALIAAGADVKAIDENGQNALMNASNGEYKEIVDALIVAGAK